MNRAVRTNLLAAVITTASDRGCNRSCCEGARTICNARIFDPCRHLTSPLRSRPQRSLVREMLEELYQTYQQRRRGRVDTDDRERRN